jgi:hypothetical protein
MRVEVGQYKKVIKSNKKKPKKSSRPKPPNDKWKIMQPGKKG